jgi:type IV secretory pathway VirB2 component (pilin)
MRINICLKNQIPPNTPKKPDPFIIKMQYRRLVIMIRFENVLKKQFISHLIFWNSSLVFAETDPATKAALEMKAKLFGEFGFSLAAILIGATFVMAKAGKITWDRFIFVGFCTAGFLGAPSIVEMIKGWVK